MKKLKDRSAIDKPLKKLTKEISQRVKGSIPDNEIADLIKNVRTMYQDVQMDIRPICFMVVTEAKVAGRNLYEHFKIFEKEMREIEASVFNEMEETK